MFVRAFVIVTGSVLMLWMLSTTLFGPLTVTIGGSIVTLATRYPGAGWPEIDGVTPIVRWTNVCSILNVAFARAGVIFTLTGLPPSVRATRSPSIVTVSFLAPERFASRSTDATLSTSSGRPRTLTVAGSSDG